MKAGAMFAPGDMYVDAKYFTPIRTGMTMKETGQFIQLKTYRLGAPIRLWVLRNRDKYIQMDSKELWAEYDRRMNEVRGEVMLAVVKSG